jgi:hypothetical protein
MPAYWLEGKKFLNFWDKASILKPIVPVLIYFILFIRNLKAECASFTCVAFYTNPSFLQLNQLLADVQTKASTGIAFCRVGLIIFGEQVNLLFLAYTCPGISNINLQSTFALSQISVLP